MTVSSFIWRRRFSWKSIRVSGRSSVLLESSMVLQKAIGGSVSIVLAVGWNDAFLVWEMQQAGPSRGGADIQGRQIVVEMEMLFLRHRLRNRSLSKI